MCLWLCKKDLFAILLHHGQLHCLTEVTVIKVAEELHLLPYKLMHWHECGLLWNTKPTNKMVADVQESGNCLNVIPDTLIEVFLPKVCIVGASFTHNAGLLCETNVLETLAHGPSG